MPEPSQAVTITPKDELKKSDGAGSPTSILPAKVPPDGKRPVIGIVVERKPKDEQDTSGPYAQAVEEHGGEVKWVRDEGRPAAELLKGVHALLIPGGRDIDPELYGEKARYFYGLNLGSKRFDEFEIAVVKEALKKGLPIRGICRGLQVLNVAAGGTLIQDISNHLDRRYPYTALNHRSGAHAIAILKGSRLHEILNMETCRVNSLHHQAVAAVAPGFMPVAIAADNIIEAIEKIDNTAILGVQFHPEKASVGSQIRERFFQSLMADARRQSERISPSWPKEQITQERVTVVQKKDPVRPVEKRPEPRVRQVQNRPTIVRPATTPPPVKEKQDEDQEAKVKSLVKGLAALGRQGYIVRVLFNRILTAETLEKDIKDCFSFEICRGEPPKEVLRCDRDQFQQLLHVAAGNPDYLDPKLRELLDLVKAAKDQGAECHTKGTWVNSYRQEAVTFDIQAVWNICEPIMRPLLVQIPGEENKLQVGSADDLRRILEKLQDPPPEPAQGGG